MAAKKGEERHFLAEVKPGCPSALLPQPCAVSAGKGRKRAVREKAVKSCSPGVQSEVTECGFFLPSLHL